MSGRGLTLAAILVSVGLNAAAQIFLRWAARGAADGVGRTDLAAALDLALRPGLWAGLICYGVSLLVWLYVLSRAEVSFAYPFLGLGFVFVALASVLWLGETLPPARLAGTALIIAGVLVLARS
jgi:multidrug transporter EmrE-like cation transporter